MKNIIIFVVPFLLCFSKFNCLRIDNEVKETSIKFPKGLLKKTWSRPCPPAFLIYPCECSTDDNGVSTTLDCSRVKSDQQLFNVFNRWYQRRFSSYTRLYIRYNSAVTSLRNGVFGDVTFEEIQITYVDNLVTVESDVFTNMAQTMSRLYIQYCPQFRNFNYDFTGYGIYKLSVMHNSLEWLNVISPSITVLEVASNNLNENLYVNAPKLQRVAMAWNNLEALPNVEQFEQLNFIHLSGNSVGSTGLLPNTLCHSDLLRTVYINSNGLSDIGLNSICVQDDAVVSLTNNQLTTLEEEVFTPIIQQVKLRGLYLEGNPFECGCDIAWIFINNYRKKIALNTKCANGEYFNELNSTYYETECGNIPIE